MMGSGGMMGGYVAGDGGMMGGNAGSYTGHMMGEYGNGTTNYMWNMMQNAYSNLTSWCSHFMSHVFGK